MRSQPGEVLGVLVNHGDPTFEANSGDNLLLFDGENKLQKDKHFKCRSGKSTVTPYETSRGTCGNVKVKESENSAIFRPYARRNRTKSNRDGPRLGSGDVLHGRNQGFTQVCPGSRDPKGTINDRNRKDQKLPSVSQLKSYDRVNEMVQKNDNSLHVESVVMSTAETLKNVHESRKELASDAKSNENLPECRKDHEKSKDANSCHAGIVAVETTVLANGSSCISVTPTEIQQTETPILTEVLVIPKEINTPHLDSATINLVIQTPKNDRDTSSNPILDDAIEHKELILVNSETRKPITEDSLETNINSGPVDTNLADIFDDRMDCDIKNSSVIIIEEDRDFQNKSEISESLRTTELNQLQVKKKVDNAIDHKSSSINVTAEVQISVVSPLVDVFKTVPTGGATADKDSPDNAYKKKFTAKMDEDSILAEAKLILVN